MKWLQEDCTDKAWRLFTCGQSERSFYKRYFIFIIAMSQGNIGFHQWPLTHFQKRGPLIIWSQSTEFWICFGPDTTAQMTPLVDIYRGQSSSESQPSFPRLDNYVWFILHDLLLGDKFGSSQIWARSVLERQSHITASTPQTHDSASIDF